MLCAPDLAGCALDNRYELHAVIGEGAFGRVYRGLDRRLARPVAVKVIKPWWAEDGAWVQRFQREAQLLARVNDPGIVQIFDIGDAEEGPYYVAELVEGESLAERLRRGPLPVAQAQAVAEQLCRALGSAHAQGVVHCDVKPGNVLLTAAGQVKVGDFGVARFAEGTSQALSATVVGTPRYMSPEQARGQATTPATDVYSAGVVLYEMLAGEPPFAGRSAVDLGLRHLQDRPPALPVAIPSGLREAVGKALAKDPMDRYRDGAAMAAALHAANSTSAPATPAAMTEKRGAGRHGGSGTEGPAGGAALRSEPATVEQATTTPVTAPNSILETRVLKRPPPPPAPGRRGHRPAPRRSRVVLLAALLLTAICALVIFLLTGAAARTTVPELRGIPRGGVEARARRMHVDPAFSTRYSETAAGIAVAQDPAAGTRITDGSTVRVVLSAGPPPVKVPDVVGQPAGSAESALASAGLRYGERLVAAPGSTANVVTAQSPRPGTTTPRRTAVALNVAESPQWRPLTTFSGVDDGRSVPFRILGDKWKVTYSMAYQGTCLVVLVCFGPSAQAHNIQTGSSFGGFELGEGNSHTHIFDGGPGLYSLQVSGGEDSARWSMAIADYY